MEKILDIVIVENGAIIKHGNAYALFGELDHPEPFTEEWLAERSAEILIKDLPFNSETQELHDCPPYLENDNAYGVKVVNKEDIPVAPPGGITFSWNQEQ